MEWVMAALVAQSTDGFSVTFCEGLTQAGSVSGRRGLAEVGSWWDVGLPSGTATLVPQNTASV